MQPRQEFILAVFSRQNGEASFCVSKRQRECRLLRETCGGFYLSVRNGEVATHAILCSNLKDQRLAFNKFCAAGVFLDGPLKQLGQRPQQKFKLQHDVLAP
nr:hypothetical protein [Pseudomonas sp. JV449]